MPLLSKRLGSIRNIVGIAVLGAGLVGCVPAEQYAGLKMDRDRLAEQLGHSQTEINEANAPRRRRRTAVGCRE